MCIQEDQQARRDYFVFTKNRLDARLLALWIVQPQQIDTPVQRESVEEEWMLCSKQASEPASVCAQPVVHAVSRANALAQLMESGVQL